MKKRLTFLLFFLLFLTGCTNDMMPLPNMSTTDTYKETSNADVSQGYNADQDISYYGSASLETKDFNKDKDHLMDIIKTNQAIIRSQDAGRYTDTLEDQQFPEARFTIDVPKDKFQAFVDQIQADFIYSSFSISSQDQTENLSNDHKRLEEIKQEIEEIETKLEEDKLTSAEKIDFRERLSLLESEKTTLETNLKDTQDSVDYSAVSITLKEVPRYYHEKPSIFTHFKRSFRGFFGYAIGLFAWSLISLFFVIPYLIVGVLTYVMTRKLVHKFVHKDLPTKKKANKDNKDKEIKENQ